MRKKKNRFVLGMVIYAIVFLAVTAAGLSFLWRFIEAYEASRPNNTVEAYMAQLTEEYIVEQCQPLIDGIDHSLQPEEQCREVLHEALSGGIRHAKNSKLSTDTRQTYVLQTGQQVLGSFVIEAGQPDQYGFRVWQVIQEQFDMSWLLGEPITVTAPDVCRVSVNGVELSDGYITDPEVFYTDLAEFYGDYELPSQRTYEAGPLLGEPEVLIRDMEGNAVTFDEHTDWSPYYYNCTEQEAGELNKFVPRFLKKYVTFAGSNKNNREKNYYDLLPYILSGSALAQRLWQALDGLQFGQSLGDQIVSMDIRPKIHMGDRFLVDITYEVDTVGKAGVVRTTTNAWLMIAETDSGLRVESIQIY